MSSDEQSKVSPLSLERQSTIREAVLTASQQWIASFNRGDADACVGAYTPDAVIQAKPLGIFRGRSTIEDFWRPFMASGAKDLVYHNINVEVVDESTVLLSAEWSMNVGRGIITKEKWSKQQDEVWRLEEDHFEIQEQFDAG